MLHSSQRVNSPRVDRLAVSEHEDFGSMCQILEGWIRLTTPTKEPFSPNGRSDQPRADTDAGHFSGCVWDSPMKM